MTVGIVVCNALESIVIADARGSMSGRKIYVNRKLTTFSGENYNGALCGAGDINHLYDIYNNLKNISGENLDDFVKGIHRHFRGKINDEYDLLLKSVKEDVEQGASLIEDEQAKEAYISAVTGDKIEQYNVDREGIDSIVLVSGFDGESGRIRNYGIMKGTYEESLNPFVSIGNGTDASNLNFAAKFLGIDPDKLRTEDLLFFAINGYSWSTLNEGIGNTPTIAHISEGNTTLLSTKQSLACLNLSGGYLAEFNPELNVRTARGYIRDILDGSVDYEKIASLLERDEETITSTVIPYTSWQETANRKIFRT